MKDWMIAGLMGAGGAFTLLAAVGIVRMPDLFTRMHAATKAATLGVSCLLLAGAVHFGDLGVTTRSLLVIAFLFLTAPVAAHMIGRAAYFVGEPLWEGTIRDDLHGRYDASTHALRSGPGESAAEDASAAEGADAGSS